MSAYFVTATGTDVGKTYVAAGILRALPGAAAIKPVMSGYDPARAAASDAGILLAAMGRPVTDENIAAISPWRFIAPLSPDMAAAREGRHIDMPALRVFCREARLAAPGLLLIEGVGGAMAPLNETRTVRDWMKALNLPVILVAGSYLGAISHTLTTAAALSAVGLTIAMIVLSESETSPVPVAETAAAINRFRPKTPIHIIPRHFNNVSFQQLAALLSEPER